MGATGRELHFDALLSKMAMAYRPAKGVADQVFPVCPVGKQHDAYPVWTQADLLRLVDQERSPGTPAKMVQPNVSSDTYFCKNYALKTPLVLEDRENMDPGYYALLKEGRAKYLVDLLSIGWENRMASKCGIGSVGSYSAMSGSWSTVDPLISMNTAIENVKLTTGYTPNRALFGWQAWNTFRRNSNVRGAIMGGDYRGGGYASTAQVANLLDMDKVLVGEQFKNTALEGVPQTLATIWPDDVLVYFAPMEPSLNQPSYGYSFRWRKPSIPDMTVELHPFDRKTKSEEVEVGLYQDEKVTASNLGFLIQAVNSSTESGI
jgi:hypothetical protein